MQSQFTSYRTQLKKGKKRQRHYICTENWILKTFQKSIWNEPQAKCKRLFCNFIISSVYKSSLFVHLSDKGLCEESSRWNRQGKLLSLRYNFLQTDPIMPLSLMQPIGSFSTRCVYACGVWQGLSHTDAIQDETLEEQTFHQRGKKVLDSVKQTLWRDMSRPWELTEEKPVTLSGLWLRGFNILRLIWRQNDCDTCSLCSIDLHFAWLGSLMFVLCHFVWYSEYWKKCCWEVLSVGVFLFYVCFISI